jgi:hypothetical protein
VGELNFADSVATILVGQLKPGKQDAYTSAAINQARAPLTALCGGKIDTPAFAAGFFTAALDAWNRVKEKL